MAGDDLVAGGCGVPISVQIAAAHPRGFDFNDDLIPPRRRIRKAFQGDTTVSLENHTEHSQSFPNRADHISAIFIQRRSREDWTIASTVCATRQASAKLGQAAGLAPANASTRIFASIVFSSLK